jgi:hypothetical protein
MRRIRLYTYARVERVEHPVNTVLRHSPVEPIGSKRHSENFPRYAAVRAHQGGQCLDIEEAPVGRVKRIAPSARNTDQNSAARTQHSQYLFQGWMRVIQVLKNIVHDDPVKTGAFKGETPFFPFMGFKALPPAKGHGERINVNSHRARIKSKKIAYPAAHVQNLTGQVTPQTRVLKVPPI